jgi:hypothetical protein
VLHTCSPTMAAFPLHKPHVMCVCAVTSTLCWIAASVMLQALDLMGLSRMRVGEGTSRTMSTSACSTHTSNPACSNTNTGPSLNTHTCAHEQGITHVYTHVQSWYAGGGGDSFAVVECSDRHAHQQWMSVWPQKFRGQFQLLAPKWCLGGVE